MHLPSADRAYIDPLKLHGYLLSEAHPVGRFKAVFFRSLGFSAVGWMDLESALLEVARLGLVVSKQATDFGPKFEVRGKLVGKHGREAEVITAWIIRNDEDFPRFITAYPR